MSTLPPRIASLLAILQLKPCQTSREIAAQYGATVGQTTAQLRILRDRGLAATTGHGRYARWGVPCEAISEAAKQARARTERRKARAAAHRAKPDTSATVRIVVWRDAANAPVIRSAPAHPFSGLLINHG